MQRLFSEFKKSGLFLKINIEDGEAIQKSTLNYLLKKGMKTAFGKEHHFKDVIESKNILQDYMGTTEVGDYLKMLSWWSRGRMGEKDVTWPGFIKNYAVSSGTSDGSSKYIPVSDEMLKAIKRASIRQVFSIARTDVPKDHMAKKWLMIGGSTNLEYNGVYYSGDLSGITTGSVPIMFQRLSKPDVSIRRERNWEDKINQITKEASKWDVGMVAGVPAWIKLLMERIIEVYGVTNIHEIWPNLEVYVHGGVSLIPYKSSLDGLMGRPIKYFETYLASEGFIAYQTRLNSNGGMRLVLKNGIYYEFIPFNDENFDENGNLKQNPKVITLSQVNDKEDYAIVITTCSGAWRYLIGDTVRFTDLDRCEIKITGRTKHFLSICGEHLSVDNMNRALEIVSSEYDANFEEFTVCGVPFEGFFAHHWFVACDHPKLEEKKGEICQKLDMTLKVLNDDYRVERSAALKDIKLTLLSSSVFIDYLKETKKLSAQTKFPRVVKNEQRDAWLNYLKTKKINF